MKPSVILRQYSWLYGRLYGFAYGHPMFPNGTPIFTSEIVCDRGLTVETKNTLYILD